MASFLIVVFPISLLVLVKLGNNFPEMKSYKISVIISFVLLSLFIISAYIKSFKCSTIIKYIPYNIAFLLMNCVFIYTQLINPIINLVKTEIQVHGLEVNKKSLIKILNSNLLYDEFLDYCNSKCCGEYAIFHCDYMIFRRIYNPISSKIIENSQLIYDSNDFTNSTFSMSCISVLTTNTQITTNFEPETGEYSINMQNIENEKLEEKKRKMSTATGDNKSSVLKSVITETLSNIKGVDPQEIGPDIQKAYENVYKIINEMNSKYFEKESTLELNIPERIIKKIKKNLSNFNENYDKMKLKQSYNHEMLNCERIFDEAHRECIETLYHNVLSTFISKKKNNNAITELKESKEAIDGGGENNIYIRFR
ncbi:hypothetical protein LY90DRAFT_678179 [Neocallimastix californiae]|uniref:RGS domain-containing protein n=1 Tax=Neocallimastix californiae TaxID=1754190 RepID=A0A1Y1ZEW2_9FUNG|nr:hypothetical protein LY90DRAFT_678179 [Neocallimastix californiae]|eukprot:ORY08759.1 hypothetical protein LY90DRAFT_678179 [Neocallimastix californiae]